MRVGVHSNVLVSGATFQGIKLFPIEDKYLFSVLTELRVVCLPSSLPPFFLS